MGSIEGTVIEFEHGSTGRAVCENSRLRSIVYPLLLHLTQTYWAEYPGMQSL